jgi:hypothetical protein
MTHSSPPPRPVYTYTVTFGLDVLAEDITVITDISVTPAGKLLSVTVSAHNRRVVTER